MKYALCVLYLTVMFANNKAFSIDKIEEYGNDLQILIPAIAYGSTFYMRDSIGREQFYKSLATNIAITYTLKYSIDKKRPNGSGQSFPSGHTAAAFQGAAFIHQRYGFSYGLPAYLTAAFVGYSRVESKNHYIEDVIAGGIIGTASALYFTQPYSPKDLSIMPDIRHNYYGLSITKEW